jgi:anti-anti-sigma regulatory factor
MNIITLHEDCGIKNVREFFAEARRSADEGADCVLDFSNVRRIDLSVAQVILALRHECLKQGGTCEIKNANESTAMLLSCAGIQ